MIRNLEGSVTCNGIKRIVLWAGTNQVNLKNTQIGTKLGRRTPSRTHRHHGNAASRAWSASSAQQNNAPCTQTSSGLKNTGRFLARLYIFSCIDHHQIAVSGCPWSKQENPATDYIQFLLSKFSSIRTRIIFIKGKKKRLGFS